MNRLRVGLLPQSVSSRLSWTGRLFGILFVLALCASLAFGQEGGQLTGTVSDPTGAVIANANVTITRVGTESKRSTKSSSAGVYFFATVAPGEYIAMAEAPGFSKRQAKLNVPAGIKVSADFKMEVGSTETLVEVTADVAAVNTVSEIVGATITSRQVTELPSLTRNPYSFVATLGNVSPNDPSNRGVGYSINGLRSAGTNVLLDGAANNDEFTASVGQQIPLDAVQEYSVATSNFTAEVGRASAGVVNVVTKSGTNSIHGTAYLFNRVSKLASNDFDNNANGVKKPIYTRNQPGISLGGPIQKNKLFFFHNSEWIKVRSSASLIRWIATPQLIAASAAETRGFYSALGAPRSDLVTLETLTKAQLQARGFNACNGGAATGPCNLLAATTPMFSRVQYKVPSDSGGGDPQDTYFSVSKVDFNPSEKTQMFIRWANENITNPVGVNADSPYSGYDTGAQVRNNSFVYSLTKTLNPAFISQTKVVFNRLKNVQPLGDRPPTPTLYFGNQAAPSILGYRVGGPGYLPFSPGNAIPFGGPQNFGQIYQDLNLTKSKHQIRFGGSFNYLRDNRTFGAYQNAVQSLGNNFGQAMDNFLQGQVRGFNGAIDPQGKYPCIGAASAQCTVNLPVGAPSFSRSFRYREWAAYLQDSYRASRRLTLNLGVRYEYFGVQKNKNQDLDSNFYPAQGSSLMAGMRNGSVQLTRNSDVGAFWRPDYNNFSPKLGFAYDMSGDGKTSLRGGYGMSFERNFGNVTFNVIQNPPNYAVIGLTAGVDVPRIAISTSNAGPLAGNVGTKALPAVTLRAVDPNIVNAYAQTWNLSLERQITPGWLQALEYTGSKGSKLYGIANRNMVGAGNVFLNDRCTAGDNSSCTARLNSQYGSINFRDNAGFSVYHALNFRSVVKNIKNSGLDATVNYTYSHAIDNLSDTFSSAGTGYGAAGNGTNLGFLDPFNPRVDKGNADFDIRNRLVVSGTWALPWARNAKGITKVLFDGWTLAPILTMRSGQVFSVFDSTEAWYWTTPRATFNSAPPSPLATPVATAQPNVNKYIDFKSARLNSSYTHPITGTAEFGPWPSAMTGRNAFRGPGNWNLDGGIYKSTRITERLKAQFRLEMYNFFNHANMFAYGGEDMAGTDFVSANRTGNRNVQLALKLIF